MNKPANNTNAKVRNTLIAALNLIKERDHWIKKRYHNNCDGHCAVGAVNRSVANIGVGKNTIRNKCIRILFDNLPSGHSVKNYYGNMENNTVLVFNDRVSTTHKHVVSLFKRAIKSLE